jgi:hypothetical protein
MVFAQSGLRSAFLARDQITAFFLAQDAIETIKNIRDDNALNNRNWLENIYVCSEGVSDDCLVSVETIYYPVPGQSQLGDVVVEACQSASCQIMKNDSLGRFGYTFTGDDVVNSRFTRNVYLKEIVQDNELQIVVEVTWTSNVRVGESRIVVQENIYNWIPRPEATP